MVRRWLMLTAALFAGCARAPNVAVEQEQPAPISTDFGRLPTVLEGIGKVRRGRALRGAARASSGSRSCANRK